MPYDNMMDDDSSPSTATDTMDKPSKDKSDETEDQLALVPNHFFKDTPKPGNREMVEVVNCYESECSVKCVYDDKKEEKEEGMDEGTNESPQDDMMT